MAQPNHAAPRVLMDVDVQWNAEEPPTAEEVHTFCQCGASAPLSLVRWARRDFIHPSISVPTSCPSCRS